MKRNQPVSGSIGQSFSFADMKAKLEYHYRNYDPQNIAPDPLQFPHRFSDPDDIELAAFLASVCAFGGVKQIAAVMEKILVRMGTSPAHFLKSAPKPELISQFTPVKHRFYQGEDIITLLLVLKGVLNKHGSIGNLIRSLIPVGEHPHPKFVIGLFHKWFIIECMKFGTLTGGLRFMIPDPSAGSSCKRFNLLLRWMVRKDELDFGLWNFLSPADLVIPVDTHIARIARELGLTSRKNANWKMAEEITARLRELDPEDPVKYDFSLCHIGIRGLQF